MILPCKTEKYFDSDTGLAMGEKMYTAESKNLLDIADK